MDRLTSQATGLLHFDLRCVYQPRLEFLLTNSPVQHSGSLWRCPFYRRADSRRNLDDPRWDLVQRIVVSRSIGRSPLLSEFLLYICERHLRDRSSELTEQRIGVQVFGRSEGYNSNDDNIVRNYARTLRKRVEEYFATEGKHEDLRLEIPRGAYVPVFYSRPLEDPGSAHGRLLHSGRTILNRRAATACDSLHSSGCQPALSSLLSGAPTLCLAGGGGRPVPLCPWSASWLSRSGAGSLAQRRLVGPVVSEGARHFCRPC